MCVHVRACACVCVCVHVRVRVCVCAQCLSFWFGCVLAVHWTLPWFSGGEDLAKQLAVGALQAMGSVLKQVEEHYSPPGWSMVWCEDISRHYYINPETGMHVLEGERERVCVCV